MTTEMNFSKTHINIEGMNLFFQAPEFGDIIEWADGTQAIITEIRERDHKGRQIIATTDIKTGAKNWPLAEWITMAWKENSNFDACKAKEEAFFNKAMSI